MLEEEVSNRILVVLDEDLPDARSQAELDVIERKVKILMDIAREGD